MTPAVRASLVERQLPQGVSPAPPPLATMAADPLGLAATSSTSSSSYDYWWPYPPGGVADPATSMSTASEPTDDPLLATTTPATEAPSSSDISDTITSASSTESASDLVHITAVVPLTESTSASASSTPSIASAYKTPRKFNVLWLTPLFALVGLLLGATIIGWTYGRWSRRRGRVSSISGSSRSGYDDNNNARGSYAHIVTGARIPSGSRIFSGTRRVSARRQDSFEDVKLVADEKGELSPLAPPRPHFPSDDEDDAANYDGRPPVTGLGFKDFSPAKAVKGWLATVRSMRSLAGAGNVDASPPRRDLGRLHVREATGASHDSQSNYSIHRHATVYRASPKTTRGVELKDDGVMIQQRLTPVSTQDDAYTFGSVTPDLTSSPRRPISSPSRFTPVAERPSSRHNRIRGSVHSDCTDDDGLRIRQSILDRMGLLKDEVSVVSAYPLESSEDEWPSPSHSDAANRRQTSPARAALKSIPGSPLVGQDLDSMQLSAEMAREKRHSTAVGGRVRHTESPSAIRASTTGNALLSRFKSRLEPSKAPDPAQTLSPTPSEALIGSAFRDAVSPRPPPVSSPLRPAPSREPKQDTTRMHLALDASVLSLELAVPPPPSKLSPSLSKGSPTPAFRDVKSKIRPVRESSSPQSQDTASIKLTISRSSSSSISSPKSGRSPQARSSLAARPSASPNALNTPPPNRIPRLSPSPTPTRPASAVTPRRGISSTDKPTIPSPPKAVVAERQRRATSPENALAALKRTPARRISATADGVGGRTISVSAAAVQARRERGASVTAEREAKPPPPPPKTVEKSTRLPMARANTAQSTSQAGPTSVSARRSTDAATSRKVDPLAPLSRAGRSNTTSSSVARPAPSRQEALNQVDAIIARSWSGRDVESDDVWKSPTNFGADKPTLGPRK